MTIKLTSGSSRLVQSAMTAVAYEKALAILGDSGVIVPMGDPVLSPLGSTTLTTLARTSSGVAVTGTWSETPITFDIPPTIEGVVPVFAFNGSDEELLIADDDYFSFGADGTAPNEPDFSFGMWVYVPSSPTQEVVFIRGDVGVGTKPAEYRLICAPGGINQITAHVCDADEDNRIGRTANTGTPLILDAWNHVVVTYDGSATNGGVAIYRNATQVDAADGGAGTYVAMENTSETIRIQAGAGYKIAGGPLGPFTTDDVLTAAQITRQYRLGQRLLGVV